jgi:hypothetical protein
VASSAPHPPVTHAISPSLEHSYVRPRVHGALLSCRMSRHVLVSVERFCAHGAFCSWSLIEQLRCSTTPKAGASDRLALDRIVRW